MSLSWGYFDWPNVSICPESFPPYYYCLGVIGVPFYFGMVFQFSLYYSHQALPHNSKLMTRGMINMGIAIPSELLTLYQIFNSCVSLSSPKLEIIYRPFLEVSNLFLSFVSLVLIPDLVVGTHPSCHTFFPSALLTIIYHDRVETWFLMPSKIY